jgi:methylmalonyl-CoA/ethylmalonyl-CoA epimerase
MIQYYTHVGHIVRDINKGIDLYTRVLGLKADPDGAMEMPGGKAIMIPVGRNFIEVIQPTDSEHRVGKFLQQRGEGLFHISFRVDDIRAEVRSLREKGIVVQDPREITILPTRPIITFLDPQSTCGATIELAEEHG